MTRRLVQQVFLGESPLRTPAPDDAWQRVERDGERFYRIANYDTMPPFFMSVVSGYDHWCFVSSTGGLTCGRRNSQTALFPYCTDDKIHDACWTTGPKTVLRVERDGRTMLWLPFDRSPSVYDTERFLYKNAAGNKLIFEEVNRSLGLTFSYGWSSSNRYGFIRRAELINNGVEEVRVELLDGVRNLLPYGVDRNSQAQMSTLVDAYKQAEAVEGTCAGLYTMSSIMTDRAEPSEALKATVVWSRGLDRTALLLSEDQVQAFCVGEEITPESHCRGKRGAFLVHAALTLPARGDHSWDLIADVEQGPSRVADLLGKIRSGISADELDTDIQAGTARLRRLAGAADGFQKSSDNLVTGRHFSNTLFNIMRGGVFPHAYEFPRKDFLRFVRDRNRSAYKAIAKLLADEGELTLSSTLERAEQSGNETFIRLVYEYLPLSFGRRHGDPSRPWNHFSIRVANGDGSETHSYEGNWRDIFQNWEALALSFPEYIESFICKFVNASTADGHNAYRISREGIDWEVLDPDDPWSNIGYWGDHQVGYLSRLLDLSQRYHPGRLAALMNRDLFVFADVPYRIKPYKDLLADPRNTVTYDGERARVVEQRVARLGSDGKLMPARDGSTQRVNLLEKLLLSALARFANFVPGGGIWMNTQRPEWNDANNALVGYGLSMVTLCYLRRYVELLQVLLGDSGENRYMISQELAGFFEDAGVIFEDHRGMLARRVTPADRKTFMDRMGAASEAYRARISDGFNGRRQTLSRSEIESFLERALEYIDHSIDHGRREDGLFDAYNLIRFGDEGHEIEPLEEMLEGQVAVLSSGYLDPAAARDLLLALRASRLYRADQNSYMLYPDRELPSFLDKNVIPEETVEGSEWIRQELASGRTDYVERDRDGRVHFNGSFRNAEVLREALGKAPDVHDATVAELGEIYESVFMHRKFTGRSGSMYKYEGLGCIYWHMVSKLLLANGEIISDALDTKTDAEVVRELALCFRDIRDGIGAHKRPGQYGAFPVDPYSHTPGFAGVQQPGLTGQVKEDVISRLWQLGVRVQEGMLRFDTVMVGRDEFLEAPETWRFSTGGDSERTEELEAGSMAFTLCGVPVVYRVSDEARIRICYADGTERTETGTDLGPEDSSSLFRREGRIAKLIVDTPLADAD
ncbi:hypothetical protein ABI59_19200 [Acidobacteria bacterium Mor1]|nr:hypothetical protein ABI59_19200 [Acidobacteria bacterium Mor1]